MSEHIIENLDSRPFAEFGAGELAQMREHGAGCGTCETAFQSARRNAAILKFEAAHTIDPSPFFQTKVLAAMKEKRSYRPVVDFWKMWQASGALVSVMLVMVAVLFFAGIAAPDAVGGNTGPVATADTAEAVIFEQDKTLSDITSEQIFQEIYER
jgi:hypothetical protein